MSHPTLKLAIGLAFAAGLMLACSKSRADTHSSADSGNAVAADDGDAPVDTSFDCAKLFAPGDVSGILSEPAKVTKYIYRSGSCSFTTENSGTVTVYSGTDLTNELPWTDITKSVHRSNYTALPGIGDEAYRNIVNGTEVFTRKGKLYCTVVLSGGTTTPSEPMARKMGALCTKLFAST